MRKAAGQFGLSELPLAKPFDTGIASRLRAGCYLISFTQEGIADAPLHYDGTLRVEHRPGAKACVSGDLYTHQGAPHTLTASSVSFHEPGRYWKYLSGTALKPGSGASLLLPFTGYKLVGRGGRRDSEAGSWVEEPGLTARLTVGAAPNSFEGTVENQAGARQGTLRAQWHSSTLRGITVELNKTAGVQFPNETSAGKRWNEVFGQVPWRFTVAQGSLNITKKSKILPWTEAELHEALSTRKREHERAGKSDGDWRYYLLCVPALYNHSGALGVMFDRSNYDTDHIPREGAAVFAQEPLSDIWKTFSGKPFASVPKAYFRTAVHEIGHALGLEHPDEDESLGFMVTTGDLVVGKADLLDPPMHFSEQHLHYLRHAPSIFVQPGGVPFGSSEAFDVAGTTPRDNLLSLEVTSLAERLPLGAPLRIHFKLTNRHKNPVPVPKELHLKSGHVRGEVIRIDGEGKPLGPPRTFTPLLLYCYAGEELEPLLPGQRKVQDLTLLRGRQGALAPQPGRYRVVVELSWRNGAKMVRLSNSAVIEVVADDESKDAAEKILNTPSVLLALAIGRRYPSAERAIKAAMKTKALRPHFDAIQAKHLGGPERPLREALRCLQKDSVITGSEYWHLKNLSKRAAADPEQADILPGFQEILKACKAGLPDGDLLEDD